jgi:biopolymer transport protein ExbB/TolQ
MFELFAKGGPFFMGIITIGLLAVLVAAIRSLTLKSNLKFKSSLSLLKQAGLFSAVMGLLGQMIGLYNALKAIEEMGNVSQAMLVGGLRVSSITTIYGLLVFAIALAAAYILETTYKDKATAS